MKVHPVVDAIRQARKVRRWTQADLAKASGVSETAISGWEAGSTSPQLAVLVRVLDVLSLRLDALPYATCADRPAIRVDPAQRFGYPNVGGVSVDAIGYMVLNEGVAVAADEYGVRRADVLVACWFLGLYGPPRRFRRLWRGWAEEVGGEMWHGSTASYDEIPDPPDEPDDPATNHKNGAPAA